jgi:8-oxo-dGTP diphosphatase
MEEAYITLKDISLSTVVESDYFGSEPDKLTYMLFYTAFIDNILDFVPNDESFSREIMEIDEFIKVFKGDKELISNIVHNAYDQKFTK